MRKAGREVVDEQTKVSGILEEGKPNDCFCRVLIWSRMLPRLPCREDSELYDDAHTVVDARANAI